MAREKNIRIRATDEELQLLHEVAKADERTLSNWARKTLLQAARAEKKILDKNPV